MTLGAKKKKKGCYDLVSVGGGGTKKHYLGSAYCRCIYAEPVWSSALSSFKVKRRGEAGSSEQRSVYKQMDVESMVCIEMNAINKTKDSGVGEEKRGEKMKEAVHAQNTRADPRVAAAP